MYHQDKNSKGTSKAAASLTPSSTIELTSSLYYFSQTSPWLRLLWPGNDQQQLLDHGESCRPPQNSISLQMITPGEESDLDDIPSLDDNSFATALTLSHTSSLFCCGRSSLDAEITQMDVVLMGRAAAEYFDVESVARLPIRQYDDIVQDPEFKEDLGSSIQDDASKSDCKIKRLCQTESDASLSVKSEEENSDHHHCDNSGLCVCCLICLQPFAPTDYVRFLPGRCQGYIHIGCIERCALSSPNFASCKLNVVDEPPSSKKLPPSEVSVTADHESSSCGTPQKRSKSSTRTISNLKTKESIIMAKEEDSGNSSFPSWTFVKIGCLLETDREEETITTATCDSESDSVIPQWSFLQIGEALKA